MNPLRLLNAGLLHRKLIIRLAVREISARYRGTMLGFVWAAAVPLLMLGVYTFIFSIVFKAKWDTEITNRGAFSVFLFSGLIIFSFFAESVNRAPGLVLENTVFVKKVIFPLEVLPWIAIIVSLFNALVSAVVLMAFYFIVFGIPPLTALLTPFTLLPVLFFTLGMVYFLSSLGVYLRDIQQAIGVFTTIILFLSPIFYPITAIPENIRGILYLNPLTFTLELSKKYLFYGGDIVSGDVLRLTIYCVVSVVFATAGFYWFQKTKNGFSDVI